MADIKPALEKLRKVKEDMQVDVEQGSDLYGRYLEETLHLVMQAIDDLERPIHHILQEDGIRVLCSQCGKLARIQTGYKELDGNVTAHALMDHLDWCGCKQKDR